MSDQDRILADELVEVTERLRASRPQLSPIELDEMKRRVMARAARSGSGPSAREKGLFMRSKATSIALTLALVASGGTAGVIAKNGGGNNGKGGGSAAKGEYKPGKGCGDKNHTHTGPPGNPSNTDCPPKAGGKK